MSNTSYIDTEKFTAHIKEGLNAAMVEAAEPLIKEALVKIEAEMRKNLASNLIAMLDADIVFDRLNTDIRILIKRV